MASPQLENGYIRIARELADQFCRRDFNGQEWRILWAVIRKTYGYNKREDVIPFTQFQQITGMDRKSVTRTIKSLRIKKVLVCKESRDGNIYRINKDYKTWVVAELPLSKKLSTVSTGRGETASGETAPGVGASPCVEVGATLCVEGRGETAPLNIQIDNRQGTFEISDLKTEAQDRRKLGAKDIEIKKIFLGRGIPEAMIDEVLGKEF